MDDGDGATYAGQKNAKGEKEGFGIKNYPNGAVYFGLWKAGKAHGQGWFFHDDGDVYKGDWADGQQNGKGVYLHADGTRYEGGWKNDEKSGHGDEFWAQDGSSYTGDYV